MSLRTRLSTLNKGLVNKIIALMYANGCDSETVSYILKEGTLADVANYIDIDDLY